MKALKVMLLGVAVLAVTACGKSEPTTAQNGGASTDKPAELPKCVISWTEAKLGDAQLAAPTAAWKSAQKETAQAARTIPNRFESPALRGDTVYIVSQTGQSIEAVGIDDTMTGAAAVATSRGLKLGDPVSRVIQLYGQPVGADSHSLTYTDVTGTKAPTLKLLVEFKNAWTGETTVQSIAWIQVAPKPDKAICQ